MESSSEDERELAVGLGKFLCKPPGFFAIDRYIGSLVSRMSSTLSTSIPSNGSKWPSRN